MANKLGRGLSALFGDVSADEVKTSLNIDNGPDKSKNKVRHKNPKAITSNDNSDGTLILPAKNEEAIEIANSIEQAIGMPTSLTVTRRGGKLSIQCKTYEELEILVNKLTADD